jgi:hypothetical protein
MVPGLIRISIDPDISPWKAYRFRLRVRVVNEAF